MILIYKVKLISEFLAIKKAQGFFLKCEIFYFASISLTFSHGGDK